MDDELEDKLIYQTYLLHMKLISKISFDKLSVNINESFGYCMKIMRSYILKPEVFFIATIIFLILLYLQAANICSRSLLEKIQNTVGRTTSKVSKLQFFVNNSSISNGMKFTWELKQDYIAAYAIQGHRPHMEDRFVVNNNINDTGVSIFAIFDGHGGQFAANYARDKLIPNINSKIVELKHLISNKKSGNLVDNEVNSKDKINNNKNEDSNKTENTNTNSNNNAYSEDKVKPLIRKTVSTDDNVSKDMDVTNPELLEKLSSLQRPVTITREVKSSKTEEKPLPKVNINNYLDGDTINYGKLITDEVLAVDKLLVQAAKKNMDIAGTTALIAVLEGNKLTVANVGDSRGVMCDAKGNAIPLSFDHKPQQQRERTRINKAGGLVIFNGVWRVAGILATSRALGDYPLKERNFVIANPDVLTFDLTDHKPSFLVFATDGLWDTFSNEEAVAFIKEHIDNEPHFGAKTICTSSYHRGSLDNITVLIVNLRSFKY